MMILKKCEVKIQNKTLVADFYGVFQISEIVKASPMIGGYPGGTIASPVAVVDFGHGLKKIDIEKIIKVWDIEDEEV